MISYGEESIDSSNSSNSSNSTQEGKRSLRVRTYTAKGSELCRQAKAQLECSSSSHRVGGSGKDLNTSPRENSKKFGKNGIVAGKLKVSVYGRGVDVR